jgi:hypothetical protein
MCFCPDRNSLQDVGIPAESIDFFLSIEKKNGYLGVLEIVL